MLSPASPSTPPAAGLRFTFLGTFLISFALLSFEITTVRTINFTVGPSYVYSAIAIAMLGLSAAGSILSLFDLRSPGISRERLLFFACVAIAALLVASHFMAAESKAALNEALETAGRAGGQDGLARARLFEGLHTALVIGLVLGVPYFFFGALLAYLFATTPGPIYGRLYAADLIGAALGSVGAIVVMEVADYALSVTAPAIAALLAAAAFAAASSRWLAVGGIGAAGTLCLLPGAAWYAEAIEPAADPNYLVRDYEYGATVEEVWHDWNSFTRVGAVEWRGGPRPRSLQALPDGDGAILSLANGDGMAFVLPPESDRKRKWRHWATKAALLLGPPQDGLVIFAGAGADLMTLDEYGAGRVTGVELNPNLVDGALGLTKYRVAEMLAKESVHLEVSEARVFLGRDRNRYDMILLSWSGASIAYYAGTLGGTTQFLFTYEGLSAVLDHLKPEGHAVILQVNKVSALAALRRYLDARGFDDPSRAAVILFEPGSRSSAWDRAVDENPLLIKPGGWSDEEVTRIAANAAKEGWEVAYAPGRPVHPDYKVYRRILQAPDVASELAALRNETNLRFDIVTDDRPFYLDFFRNDLYLSGDFWKVKTNNWYHVFRWIRVVFVMTIIVLAAVLILAPLFLRRGPAATRRTVSHLTFFFSLGGGFMFLEIVLMQKGSLLFGNPGLTIAIVLASMILFSGIGSLISNWTFRNGLSFRATAAAVFAYALILHFGLDTALYAILPWPLAAKAAALAVIIAPAALLMGHLLPQGLGVAARDSAALVPWAWGINGAMSTISAGIAPLMAQAWGFGTLILIAAGFYGLILFLPTCRRDAPTADIAVEMKTVNAAYS